MALKRFGNLFKLSDKRDVRIDSIKGLLILLVVIGHQIEPFTGGSTIIYAVYMCIYSFHMPLFVMISGYLMNPSMDRRKLLKSELILFEALVVFQILRCLLQIYHGEFSWSMLTTPRWTLWYMLSLIFWRFFLYCIYNIKIARELPFIVFGLSVMLAVVCGFIPLGWEFSFQRTFYFFPFFVLGALLNDKNKKVHKFRFSRGMAIGGGILLISSALYVAYSIAVHPDRSIFYGSIFYGNGYNVLTRVSCIVVGMTISLLIFRYFPTIKILALIGTATLTIYLFHSFIVEQISIRVVGNGLLSDNIFTLTVIAMLVTLGLFLFSKVPMSSWIINPLTRLSAFLKSKHFFSRKNNET